MSGTVLRSHPGWRGLGTRPREGGSHSAATALPCLVPPGAAVPPEPCPLPLAHPSMATARPQLSTAGSLPRFPCHPARRHFPRSWPAAPLPVGASVCLLRVPQPSEEARSQAPPHAPGPEGTGSGPEAPPQSHPTASFLPLLMQGRAGPPRTTSPAEPPPSSGASPGHTWALASDSPSHPHTAKPPLGQCPWPRHGRTGAGQLPPSD